jgi:hypothetical protein
VCDDEHAEQGDKATQDSEPDWRTAGLLDHLSVIGFAGLDLKLGWLGEVALRSLPLHPNGRCLARPASVGRWEA